MERWTCLVPVVAVVGSLGHATRASACSPNPCADTAVWYAVQPVNPAQVPADGVLVLLASNTGAWPGELGDIRVMVSRAGMPVDGALEATEIEGVLVWRPAAPLVAGVHAVTGAVDNPEDSSFCQGDLALDFEFTAVAEQAAPLRVPVVTASEQATVTAIDDLASLVCCEGSPPGTSEDSCGGRSPSYEPGTCAPTTGTGTLAVELPIAPMLPGPTAGLLAYTLKVDGEAVRSTINPEFVWQAERPFCTEVEVLQLATGERLTTEKQCHGAAVADQLGAQELDPTLELTCTQPLQTCEVDAMGAGWDLNSCVAWSDEQAGCGCVGGDAPGGWGALALLGIAGLRRRRRRQCALVREPRV